MGKFVGYEFDEFPIDRGARTVEKLRTQRGCFHAHDGKKRNNSGTLQHEMDSITVPAPSGPSARMSADAIDGQGMSVVEHIELSFESGRVERWNDYDE